MPFGRLLVGMTDAEEIAFFILAGNDLQTDG